MILEVDISMRDYAQWGIIALFFASTVYFLCLDFSWMRKGKPARWKNGYTIVRMLGVLSVIKTAVLKPAARYPIDADHHIKSSFQKTSETIAAIHSTTERTPSIRTIV